MTNEKKRAPWINWVLFFSTMVVVFLLGLLASSITERRAENEYVFKPKVKLSEYEPRNVLWGENFPREYQSYLKTGDTTFRSMFNGSAMIDELEEDPRMVVLWSGYAFSKDYTQSRGHYYAITDIRNTLRTGTPQGADDGPQPNTCWTCKGPDVPKLIQEIGIKEFYKGKWASRGDQIVNYIGCADCHDPKTMDLRITRPALTEAFQSMGKDISKATHQEMRSLVCAQCHVEYFFNKNHPDAPEISYLTFPWQKGTSADQALAYYDSIGFSDFIHTLSKTPILKAQHPDYELYLTGIHADRGVACADCHMPYIKEGGQKFTSHKITSPLSTISTTCQVCHRESEESLRENVYERQEKVKEIRDQLEIQLVRAHLEARAAWEAGATEKEMAIALQQIRRGQWFWDYSAASHGASFHSPIEVSRIIGFGINAAQEARVQLARLLSKSNRPEEIPYPDINTKSKAQKFIGLPMDVLNREKSEWIKTIIPQWDQKAKDREKTWPISM